MRVANLSVPSGMGDILWVYRKVAPHVDRINFFINYHTDDIVSPKIRLWPQRLPKVELVLHKLVSIDDYYKLTESSVSLSEVVHRAQSNEPSSVNYCVNYWLQKGINLEKIDLAPVEWHFKLDIPTNINANVWTNSYIFYVPEMPRHIVEQGYWTLEKWEQFILGFLEKYGTKNVSIVGTMYDLGTLRALRKRINEKGIQANVISNMNPVEVVRAARNCKFFVGFQSGIGVLADHLGANQLMLYMPQMESMMNTWCIPHHYRIRYFASTFDEPIDRILANLPDRISS